jgi:hypothetical protein
MQREHEQWLRQDHCNLSPKKKTRQERTSRDGSSALDPTTLFAGSDALHGTVSACFGMSHKKPCQRVHSKGTRQDKEDKGKDVSGIYTKRYSKKISKSMRIHNVASFSKAKLSSKRTRVVIITCQSQKGGKERVGRA